MSPNQLGAKVPFAVALVATFTLASTPAQGQVHSLSYRDFKRGCACCLCHSQVKSGGETLKPEQVRDASVFWKLHTEQAKAETNKALYQSLFDVDKMGPEAAALMRGRPVKPAR
jgi:hypothetical protein